MTSEPEDEDARAARVADEALARAIVRARPLRLAGLAYAGDPDFLCREMQQAVMDDRLARGLEVDHGDASL